MKTLTTLASAAALALSLAAVSAPAHAAVIAQFTPDTNASDFKWINDGANNTGAGGHFFTVSDNASTVAQGVATHFSFLDPSLALLSSISAVFKVDATVSATPATNNSGLLTQSGLTGTFSFIYAGPTIDNFNGSGITLFQNSNLLSGVFGNATIEGSSGSGSANLAAVNGGTMTFTSDFLSPTRLKAGTEEFAFNLLSTTPKFGKKTGAALQGFSSNGGGNFSADAVPEPATWGLMIVGFGGLGALARHNRRRAAVATA